MPAIFGSLRSPWTQDFEEELNKLELNATVVEFDFPAVARVMYACRGILKNTYYRMKMLVQDEDAWKAAIEQLFEKERNKIHTIDDLTAKIMTLFVGTVVNLLKDKWRDNINDCISSLDIVVRAYLEKSAEELQEASQKERAISMVPQKDTKTVADDLREAEKVFEKTLSHEILMNLRQLSSQMAAR